MATTKTKRIKKGDIVSVRGYGMILTDTSDSRGELAHFDDGFGSPIKFRVLRREGDYLEVGDLSDQFSDLRWGVFRFQVKRV